MIFRDEGAHSVDDASGLVHNVGGDLEIGNTNCAKGIKIKVIIDRSGLPLSVSTYGANHHDVKLVQLSFDFDMIEAMPTVLIGDRAFDSDDLDDNLRD